MDREIEINGMKFKLPAVVCDALEAQRRSDAAATQARIDAFAAKKCEACGKVGDACECEKKKADALAAVTARADAAAAEVVKLKADATASAAAMPKLVADALEVVDVARRAGVEVKIDALDLPALRRAVAEKVNGVSLEGKSDAYVAAAFDLAAAKVNDTATGAGVLGVHHEPKPSEKKGDETAEGARAKMAQRNADAWKTPAAK